MMLPHHQVMGFRLIPLDACETGTLASFLLCIVCLQSLYNRGDLPDLSASAMMSTAIRCKIRQVLYLVPSKHKGVPMTWS